MNMFYYFSRQDIKSVMLMLIDAGLTFAYEPSDFGPDRIWTAGKEACELCGTAQDVMESVPDFIPSIPRDSGGTV